MRAAGRHNIIVVAPSVMEPALKRNTVDSIGTMAVFWDEVLKLVCLRKLRLIRILKRVP